MNPGIIGIKELHKELTRVAAATQKGKSFIVLKHAKPIFRIEPVRQMGKKRYTIADILELQFHSGKKSLSKNIDKIVYGI